MHRTFKPLAAAALLLAALPPVRADDASGLMSSYEAAARQADPGFRASAARGEQFFTTAHGAEWSCSSCHTPDPRAPGKHAKTGKPILPLAPAANPERFTRADKTEKWFRRNCNDVLNRPCTPMEKSDVLAYLTRLGGSR